MCNYFHCQGKTTLLMILLNFWQTTRLFFNFYWQCGDQILVNSVQWHQLSNHRRKHLDCYPCRKKIGTWTYGKALLWTTLKYYFYRNHLDVAEFFYRMLKTKHLSHAYALSSSKSLCVCSKLNKNHPITLVQCWTGEDEYYWEVGY